MEQKLKKRFKIEYSKEETLEFCRQLAVCFVLLLVFVLGGIL